MAFGDFSSGPYVATYDRPTGTGAVSIGLVEGPRALQRVNEVQDMRTDLFGATVIDGVYRGGQCFVSMIFKEWNDNTKDALWPYDSDFGGHGDPVGRLQSDIAGVLLLTAVPGTPAAEDHGPLTLSFPLAILAPQNNISVSLGSVERNVPILFRCYPDGVVSAGGGVNDIRWFTETDPP